LENIDLDPADAEYENGLLEFQNGVSCPQHRRHRSFCYRYPIGRDSAADQ
jgi:hypothetical protein